MRIIILILLLNFVKASAQHCGYDHTALLGVRVVDANNELVKGLRILMLDEKGNPVMVNKDVTKTINTSAVTLIRLNSGKTQALQKQNILELESKTNVILFKQVKTIFY